MSDRFVLDASAILCVLNNETGWESVVPCLEKAAISSVNYCEVISKLSQAGFDRASSTRTLDPLRLDIRAFDAAAALDAGLLRSMTKSFGLSLGEGACLALAQRLHAIAVTTDRAWQRVEADLGIDILIVR